MFRQNHSVKYTILTIAFGALPASVFCWWALLAILFGFYQFPIFPGLLMILWGAAGFIGTYSLWMVAFGFRSRIITTGLVAGIVAMMPFLIIQFAIFRWPSAWLGVLMAQLFKLGPLGVALGWLLAMRKEPRAAAQSLTLLSRHGVALLSWNGIALFATCAIAVMALLWPMWATPIARQWYGSGFESAVAEALADLPGSGDACIYDDAQHRFVASIGQLDMEGMIEKAVRARSPIPRLDRQPIDPHFRVYSGGRTYYWSFRRRKLIAFEGDRWSLDGNRAQPCQSYKQSSDDHPAVWQARAGAQSVAGVYGRAPLMGSER